MDQIQQVLTRLFERHRIVFWHDAKAELRAEFDALEMTDITKIFLDNNEFGVKHRISRQEPAGKFLLYRAGPPPADLDNWLLDVQLAYGEFRADQTALWLSELELGLEFAATLQPHAEFFQTARRRQALKALLQPDDTPRQVQMKMLAVCSTGAEPRLDDILENLLAELATGKDEKIRLVQRCELDGVLWEQAGREYHYASATPSVRDFAIALFKSAYASGIGEAAGLNSDALVFLKRWRDNVRYQTAFARLSEECADILSIEQDLQQRDYRQLVELDLFELIDRKILSALVQDIAARTLAAGECEQIVRQRRQGRWYATYQHPYEALEIAASFLQMLDTVDLTVRSLVEGVQQYSRVWFQIDQLYRRFIYHARRSGQTTLLAPLLEMVENLYINKYLLALNDDWQRHVDACARWDTVPVLQQSAFFAERVRPYLQKGNKVFVIISDAMRYEVGEELLRRIRQEDRYDATLEPALTLLPSYTQLGMAALLPHQTLQIAGDASGAVLVDGFSSMGTESRKKILEQALAGKATAVKAEELLAMGREESRALARDHDVVYVYHNRIDATGDKRESEERVFEAVEETLEELVTLIKKLANANANNLLVTADHGFLYQNRSLEESDFASSDPAGTFTLYNRRYVVGNGLVPSPSFKHFTAAEVGLLGDGEMLLPKSINRLRLKGAGSRYVHGGATLQEVVIPVIRINKKRQSDLTTVEVDILRGSTTVISTGQFSVALYQIEAVTEKTQPRSLRAGIYTQAGAPISDQHDLTFDLTSENAREREVRVQFVLTKKADEANNQEVILRLDERVADTSHYREYKSARYTLRRSFTSDFDF